jgi:thiosulfate reductase/polysulfide reductase chain A
LTRFLRKWGKLRREQPNRTKVVVINPRYSVTAAKSDEWIPIQPGTDAALALGIAHVIIREKLYDETFVHHWTEGFDAYKNLVLRHYSPSVVSEITGISSEAIQRTAREFSQTKPAIALSGMGAVSWPGGSHITHAVFCLNALVGSIDVPGGIIYQVHQNTGMGDGLKMKLNERQDQPYLDFRGQIDSRLQGAN